MNPTEEHIKEIAELLDCGELCYFHEATGTIEHHPDPNNEYFDPEPWQETLDRIDANWGEYLQFEKMDSNQSLRVMEDFANSLTDENFRTRLLTNFLTVNLSANSSGRLTTLSTARTGLTSKNKHISTGCANN